MRRAIRSISWSGKSSRLVTTFQSRGSLRTACMCWLVVLEYGFSHMRTSKTASVTLPSSSHMVALTIIQCSRTR
jgi:hypothetical protein